MGFWFGANAAEIAIQLDGESQRDHVRRTLVPPTPTRVGTFEQCPVYVDSERIAGKVTVMKKDHHTRALEHSGIAVEFHGAIDLGGDKSQSEFLAMRQNEFLVMRQNEFLVMRQALVSATGPPLLAEATTFSFDFGCVKMPHGSYDGSTVSLRYFLRVTVGKPRGVADSVKERTIWVLAHAPAVTADKAPVTTDIGLRDFLHLQLRLDGSTFAFDSVIAGTLLFHQVRLRVKSVDLQIERHEVVAVAASSSLEEEASRHSETLAKHQILDGPAYRGDQIPFRFYLASCAEYLTPSYESVEKIFSIKYFVNVVLHDEDGRRYFKLEEIQLFRQ